MNVSRPYDKYQNLQNINITQSLIFRCETSFKLIQFLFERVYVIEDYERYLTDTYMKAMFTLKVNFDNQISEAELNAS